eukprot:scaffold266063_cov17-Tisochrysis_lutea.AAC.1
MPVQMRPPAQASVQRRQGWSRGSLAAAGCSVGRVLQQQLGDLLGLPPELLLQLLLLMVVVVPGLLAGERAGLRQVQWQPRAQDGVRIQERCGRGAWLTAPCVG